MTRYKRFCKKCKCDDSINGYYHSRNGIAFFKIKGNNSRNKIPKLHFCEKCFLEFSGFYESVKLQK